MSKQTGKVHVDNIHSYIRTIRGQKVILADDLARLYGVPTKRLNEQVKRNEKRFPDDFMFRLTRPEAEAAFASRSQIATLKRGRNIKHLPFAFSEHGAVMSANVLNSPQAVRMSVFVVRAFVKMRELLAGTRQLAVQLKKLEAKLTNRLDSHETAIVEILQRITDILNPATPPPVPPRRPIGFHTRPAADNGDAAKGSRR